MFLSSPVFNVESDESYATCRARVQVYYISMILRVVRDLSDRLSSPFPQLGYSIMGTRGSRHGPWCLRSERVWDWSRVALAYEQLVRAHCGREDTLRKCLESSHVRDQP